ncbi:MAG: DNA topoisomerase IV subunit A [Verrucomicrobia bacterium]|nr:DNA topoisomerase IV subunit A [Verrucomicrobiota bacterium]MDE3047024.1 DNA topoisomerase IV subunit A [Verrucomicrobiota bacterium]
MDDLKHLMRDHFVRYASYVILDRAIPNVVDGLKPVQRRILEILWRQSDEKMHKVANMVGQTMQLHPHGDAPIYEALVTLANKNYVLDKQGNFGSLYTGDPAAAARYIETRLSALARETLFNPDITEKIPSYDGRNEEPVTLPAKIPLLLMQGAEGIAVGMATRILPHNFKELLEAEIAYLEGKNFKIFPDFPTGGIMDKSEYDKGYGKVKLRAKIEIKDPKTLVIREICYGTTTESLIRSIDEAAKKGKIKIEEINDYTAENVEIEVKLPRGQYAEELLDALYGFTECEVSLNSQVMVIKDGLPWETNVHDILAYNAEKLVTFLRRELEIERDRLLEKIFYKTLERIFIENRLYKKIETVKTLEKIHETLSESLAPYRKKLLREPTHEDREKLLQIPIRRISQFDIDRNKDEIALLEETLNGVLKHLKNVKKFTIHYLQTLLEKYGPLFPRKTRVKAIEEIDRRAIETKEIKVGFDPETGFVGTKVTGAERFTCTNFDKLLILHKDGTYKVVNIPEKQYFEGAHWVGVADKKTVLNVVYKIKDKGQVWAKRFIVDKFILDKTYRYFDEKGELQCLSTDPKAEIELQFTPSQKQKKQVHLIADIPLSGAQTRGVRLSPNKVKKVVCH